MEMRPELELTAFELLAARLDAVEERLRVLEEQHRPKTPAWLDQDRPDVSASASLEGEP